VPDRGDACAWRWSLANTTDHWGGTRMLDIERNTFNDASDGDRL